MKHNFILRKGISFLLMVTLLCSGFFIAPASAETVKKTKMGKAEIYDLAYFDIWKHENNVWQRNIKPGSPASQEYTISENAVPEGAVIKKITGKFNDGYGGDYINFAVKGEHTSVHGISYEYQVGEQKSTKAAELTYTVNTKLITQLEEKGKNIKEPWQAPNVEGYRYYIPVYFQIDYEITTYEEIPDPDPDPVEDLTADLDTPSTVKTEEHFTVSDATKVGADTILESATLWRRIDGGAWEALVTWKGKGKKGQNTGGSLEQSFDTPLTAEYKIVSVTEGGTQDERMRSTTVEDGTVMDVEAILSGPDTAYEGVPFEVNDSSVVTIDGESYSALRAYEEGKATNKFSIVESGAGSIRKDKVTPVYATATFPNKGYYNVQLKISPKNGSSLYDTKPIEVLKTPTVKINDKNK